MLSSLAGLTALRSLDLSMNKIEAEHLEAAHLTAPRLTKLHLCLNHGLKALPASVAAMASLADLDLRGTALAVLPPGPYLGARSLAAAAVCELLSHVRTRRDVSRDPIASRLARPSATSLAVHAGSLKSLNLEACPVRRLPAQLSGAQLAFGARPTRTVSDACCSQTRVRKSPNSMPESDGSHGRPAASVVLGITYCQHPHAGASRLEDLRLGGTVIAIHGTSTAMLRLLGSLPRLRQVSPSPDDPAVPSDRATHPSLLSSLLRLHSLFALLFHV